MKLPILYSSVCVFVSAFLFAQNGSTPVSGQNPYGNSSVARSGDPNTPQDGNASIGPTYQFSACGLNYTTASQKIGQRVSPPGVPQPATFAIAGIPATAVIQKAYVWTEGSGNGVAITINLTNPFAVSSNFNMTLIGTDQDKCWGFQSTTSYRADVTSLVVGNGNYTISGLPTSPSSSSASNDMDGATMMVIWSDPTANFQGDIVIWDGCYVGIGTQQSVTLNGFQACSGTVSNARAFMGIGDLQGLNTPLTLNNNAPFVCVEDWWNWVDNTTTVTPGQNTSFFDVNASGDCYNIAVCGLYWQSNCQTCCANPFTLNMSSTASQCSASNGSATAVPVGGTGTFTYSWNTNPVQTGQTATGIPPGMYVVTVTDSLGCTTIDSVLVQGTGLLSISTSQVNVICNGGNNGSATINATSGTSPYTYVWSPNVSSTNTASTLTAGVYSVDITDLYGCQNSYTFTITEPPLVPLVATGNGSTTICLGFSATLDVSASGGAPPYSYLWLNNGSTNDTITVAPATTTTYSVVISDACNTPPDTAFITVTVNQLPVLAFAGDQLSGCAPLCVTFTPQSNPAIANAYWTFGDGNNSVQTGPVNCYQLPGSYDVELHVTDINGCIDSVNISNYITVHPDPTAAFTITSPQPTTMNEANVTFQDNSTGADTCKWDFGDGYTVNVAGCGDMAHFYGDTGAYNVQLVVVNQWGCSDTIDYDVYIIPSTSIYVPNSFTPNGDGKNDIFYVYGDFIADFHMYVFDRWGNQIFESTDQLKGWNGKANNGNEVAQIDTYVWVVTYSEEYGGYKHKLIGHVNLIR